MLKASDTRSIVDRGRVPGPNIGMFVPKSEHQVWCLTGLMAAH